MSHRILGVESFSILFNHGSIEKPAGFFWVSDVFFLERRIPGKNGEVSPRRMSHVQANPPAPKHPNRKLA